MSLWLKEGGARRGNGLVVWEQHRHTAMFKTHNQEAPIYCCSLTIVRGNIALFCIPWKTLFKIVFIAVALGALTGESKTRQFSF